MKFVIRCKSLQEVERYENIPVNCEATLRQQKDETNSTIVVIANFQQHKDSKLDCYIGIDAALVDDNLRIGDEYEVEIRKVS
jgi:hypothetical protein